MLEARAAGDEAILEQNYSAGTIGRNARLGRSAIGELETTSVPIGALEAAPVLARIRVIGCLHAEETAEVIEVSLRRSSLATGALSPLGGELGAEERRRHGRNLYRCPMGTRRLGESAQGWMVTPPPSWASAQSLYLSSSRIPISGVVSAASASTVTGWSSQSTTAEWTGNRGSLPSARIARPAIRNGSANSVAMSA